MKYHLAENGPNIVTYFRKVCQLRERFRNITISFWAAAKYTTRVGCLLHRLYKDLLRTSKKLAFTLLEIYFHISDAGFYQCVWCICIFQTIFRMGLMKRNMVSCITSQKNFEKIISLVQCFSYTKNYFSIHLITYQPLTVSYMSSI